MHARSLALSIPLTRIRARVAIREDQEEEKDLASVRPSAKKRLW
jgi:hypothetical protein